MAEDSNTLYSSVPPPIYTNLLFLLYLFESIQMTSLYLLNASWRHSPKTIH